MNRIVPALAGAVLLCIVLPGSVLAQRIDSPYRFVQRSQSVGLYGGYVDASPGVIDFGPQSGPAIGARYRIRLGGAFDGEVDLAIIPTNRLVTDTIIRQGARQVHGEAPATLLSAQAGLRFNITGARTFYQIQPFLLFGGGAVLDLSGRDELDEALPQDVRFRFGTSFAGQFGGGAEWYATERLSLRLDARNVLWRLRTPAGFRIGDAAREIPEAAWRSNLVFGAGVGLHF